jgi:hypothetical protein
MHLTSGLVGAEVKGPIGWLIWDNPSKLNALSPGMYEDALSVVEDYAANPAIKVVAAPAGKLLSLALISRVSRRRAPTPKPRGWRGRRVPSCGATCSIWKSR